VIKICRNVQKRNIQKLYEKKMNEIPKSIEQDNVSLVIVWKVRAGKYDSQMSEISLEKMIEQSDTSLKIH
jgi:hypothetical protein